MTQELTIYEKYHNVEQLLGLQKNKDSLCCNDELRFQIIPQICELHFKVVLHHIEIAKFSMEENDILEAVNNLSIAIEHIKMATLITKSLENLKPIEWNKIRLVLKNGSGQDSPGFKEIKVKAPKLWGFMENLLDSKKLSLLDLQLNPSLDKEIYILLEKLFNLDQEFKNYRYQHMMLVRRTIGINSMSLKGVPSKMLEAGTKAEFYPKLWRSVEELTNYANK